MNIIRFIRFPGMAVVALLGLGVSVIAVYGAPDILDESFDYGATDLVKPIGPWTGGASSLFIYDADGGIDDARLNSKLGGAIRLTNDTTAFEASRSFTPFSLSTLSEGNVVWVAVLFDYVTGTTRNHYVKTSGGTVSGLGVTVQPDGSILVFGSDNGSANGDKTTGLTVPGSGTYLMVIRGTKGAGSSPTASTIDFWLNPADTSSIDNLGSPDWTTGADSKWGRDTESLSVASVGLSVGGRTDEIRIGTDFYEVVGVASDAVELWNNSVATNVAPGTLVGTVSDTLGLATHFVLTNAPVGGSAADNGKFQITDGTNLRTRVWMSQYSNDVSIAAMSNTTALVTNSFPVLVTASSAAPIFVVAAEVTYPASNGELVGTMMSVNDSATFTIVGGRLDLFTKDGDDNLLVTNAPSWGAVGTTNYVTLRATGGGQNTDMVVGVAVVDTPSLGSVFRFR